MTEVLHDTSTATGTRPVRPAIRPIWAAAGVAGAIAAAATTLVAAGARAVDVTLDVDGEPIPLLGFAQLTLVGALIGAVLASILHRRARAPRRTFVITTIALTAVSIVPDLLIDASAASKVVLAATHVLAAAIIVPPLAARVRP